MFENTVEKREQFAVNLRKKKTQEIVKAKRRKIIEAMSSKSKAVVSNGDNDLIYPPKAYDKRIFDHKASSEVAIIDKPYSLVITNWIWSALGLSIHI